MPYSASLPILLTHLEKGGYPDEVMQVIAHRLGVKPGIEYWERLRDSYYRETGEAVRDGLAATLAEIATKAQFDVLVQLVRNEALGDSRISSSATLCAWAESSGMTSSEPWSTIPCWAR